MPDVCAVGSAEYQYAVDRFVETVSTDGDVAAIFRFGSWREPGVSDLDLLAVAAPGRLKQAAESCDTAITRSALTRYLFVHRVVVIPQSCIDILPYFHTIRDLQPVAGKCEELERIAEPPRGVALIRHLVWTSLAWRALIELEGGVVGLRRLLLLLNIGVTSVRMGLAMTGRDAAQVNCLRQLRERILSTGFDALDEECRVAYRAVLGAMAETDWAVQDWACGAGLLRIRGPLRNVPISPSLVFRFVATRPGDGTSDAAEWRRLYAIKRRGWSVALPGLYYGVFSLIAPALERCAPAVPRVFAINSGVEERADFRDDCLAYRRAVARLAEEAFREGAPSPFPYPLPTPFGLGTDGAVSRMWTSLNHIWSRLPSAGSSHAHSSVDGSISSSGH